MGSALLSGGVVLAVDTDNSVFDGGWVAIRNGRIVGVGDAASCPDGASFDEVYDARGRLLMPGLVNAHTHSAMILFRGRAEGHSLLTMEGWFSAIREPELSLRADDIAPAVKLSCAEMVLSGTTTFCDQYFFADEIAAAVGETGMRAVVAYGIVELGDETHGAEELARASAFIERQRSGDGRVIPWFGPHAPYVDNSEGLVRAEVATAKKYGVGMHLHMAAGPEDNEPTLSKYGLTATQALERDGFFEGRVHAAHCLDLSDEDTAIFARAPAASVAYCATAGLRSGRAGACPAVPLRAAGVTVALGTDNVAANNSYDMFSEMKVAGLVASHREGRAQVISSTDLIRMATVEGARALGLDHDTGSLEVGKSADVIAVDIAGAGYSEAPDYPSLIVYSGSGRDVSDVWVAGERLVKNSQLTRQPLATIRREYTHAYDRFWRRVAEARKVA